MNNSNQIYKEAVESITNSVQYMIAQTTKNMTQIYNGIVVSVNNNNYTISVNGQEYIIKQYGNLIHVAGDVVKVFIPQGNMNIAFFI